MRLIISHITVQCFRSIFINFSPFFFCVVIIIGMADYQVLPPGLNSMNYHGVPIDPKDFQLSGNTL